MIFHSRGQIVLLLWWHCKSVKYKGEVVHFNFLPLFLRLTSIAEWISKFTEHFKYELTQEPISLFKDGFLRKSHKTDLENILIENTYNIETYCSSKLLLMKVHYFIKYHGLKIVLIVKSLINIVIIYKIIMV